MPELLILVHNTVMGCSMMGCDSFFKAADWHTTKIFSLQNVIWSKHWKYVCPKLQQNQFSLMACFIWLHNGNVVSLCNHEAYSLVIGHSVPPMKIWNGPCKWKSIPLMETKVPAKCSVPCSVPQKLPFLQQWTQRTHVFTNIRRE